MKNLLCIGALLGMFLTSSPLFAQYEQKGWMFGGGFNFIDDSGTSGAQPFDFDDNWSSVIFPSRFSLGYALTNGMFFQGFASYNKYQKDTFVNGAPQSAEWNYYALDGMVGYGFKDLIDRRGWFDPFINTGFGIKRLAGSNDLTYNLGGGFNFWFNESLALNLSTLGKWTLSSDSGDNHIQHGIGLIFKPDLKKLFAKQPEKDSELVHETVEAAERKDRELLASTEDMPTEAPAPEKTTPEPVKDTVEENKVAEKASAEKPLPTKDVRKAVENRLKQDLASVQPIAFAVNSSFFQAKDQEKLEQLVAFMNYYPTVIIEIRGNADPRGTEEYNAWLSVRRAKRIKDYLIARGIASHRMNEVGSGEQDDEDPCANGKPCSEKELEESRRVEYTLLGF